MRVFLEILTMYALYGFICAAVIARSVNRNRLSAIAIALTFPALCVFALVMTVLRPMSVRPCPSGLEDVEQAVETKRQQMFGGQPRRTVIARNWQSAYALHLEAQTRQVAKATTHMKAALLPA